jgi:hypothetical protein
MAFYVQAGDQGAEISNNGWCNVLLLAQHFGWDGRCVKSRSEQESECDSAGDAVHEIDVEAVAEEAEAEDEDRPSPEYIPVECAASFADALETALAVLRMRNPSEEEAIAARARVRALTFNLNPDYDLISTEDLIDAFGHQQFLLEEVIAVARAGEVSIW